MGRTSNMNKPKSNHQSVFYWGAVGMVILAVVGLWIFFHTSSDTDIYTSIQCSGYNGTQEQWLASLAGEDLKAENSKTAFDLAVENGYTGSHSQWMKTIVGVESEDTYKTAYELAVDNGFNGTLVQWLEQLVEEPEVLGKSEDPNVPTAYEWACKFGYSGTFLEWLVSVSHDSVTP